MQNHALLHTRLRNGEIEEKWHKPALFSAGLVIIYRVTLYSNVGMHIYIQFVVLNFKVRTFDL